VHVCACVCVHVCVCVPVCIVLGNKQQFHCSSALCIELGDTTNQLPVNALMRTIIDTIGHSHC